MTANIELWTAVLLAMVLVAVRFYRAPKRYRVGYLPPDLREASARTDASMQSAGEVLMAKCESLDERFKVRRLLKASHVRYLGGYALEEWQQIFFHALITGDGDEMEKALSRARWLEVAKFIQILLSHGESFSLESAYISGVQKLLSETPDSTLLNFLHGNVATEVGRAAFDLLPISRREILAPHLDRLQDSPEGGGISYEVVEILRRQLLQHLSFRGGTSVPSFDLKPSDGLVEPRSRSTTRRDDGGEKPTVRSKPLPYPFVPKPPRRGKRPRKESNSGTPTLKI